MNKVTLSGRLTRDPEVRYTQKGMAWATSSIAVDRRSKEKAADFFNLVAWDKTAEIMGKYLKKGSKVLIDGHLQFSQYNDKNGDKKSKVDVIVDSLEFMDGKPQGQKSDDAPTPPPDYYGHAPDDMPF